MGYRLGEKRWHDIKEGDFVPDPVPGFVFGSFDDWCRVDTITGEGAVTLRHPDTSLDTVTVIPDKLVPFCTRASWLWGDITDHHGVSR